MSLKAFLWGGPTPSFSPLFSRTCVQDTTCDQPKRKPLKYSTHRRELYPGHREGIHWDSFILPLRYHDPRHEEGRQWGRYIHSPTGLSWPRPWREQTVRFIHSPTGLSWPRPWREQKVRYIHSPTELSWTGPQRGPFKNFKGLAEWQLVLSLCWDKALCCLSHQHNVMC